MSGWGYFFLVLLILIILIPACWIIYTRIRASRAGLPPPPWSSYLHPFSSTSHEASSSRIYPASRSPLDWIRETFSTLRGSGGGGGRSRAGGAYEPTGGRRGLDPDEAWDSRVGAEADAYGAGGYYEEQELGLHPPPAGSDTAYLGAAAAGAGRGGVLPDYGDHHTRGRQLSRDEDEDDDTFVGGNQRGLDSRYDEEVHGGGARSGGRGGRGGEDPFGDHAEQSSLRGVSPRPVVDTAADGGLKPSGKAGDTSPTERRSMFRESI